MSEYYPIVSPEHISIDLRALQEIVIRVISEYQKDQQNRRLLQDEVRTLMAEIRDLKCKLGSKEEIGDG